jgi:hypothetical protein
MFATAKGFAASRIAFVEAPEPVWEYPSRVLYSRDGRFGGGFQIVQTLGPVYSRERYFATARWRLLQSAAAQGGNAVVITEEWKEQCSTSTGPSIGALLSGSWLRILNSGGTYYYTEACFVGVAVIVARQVFPAGFGAGR